MRLGTKKENRVLYLYEECVNEQALRVNQIRQERIGMESRDTGGVDKRMNFSIGQVRQGKGKQNQKVKNTGSVQIRLGTAKDTNSGTPEGCRRGRILG